MAATVLVAVARENPSAVYRKSILTMESGRMA